MKSNALTSLAAAATCFVAADASHAGHARRHEHHARAPAAVKTTWTTSWVTVVETICPTECPASTASAAPEATPNIPFYEQPAVRASAQPESSQSAAAQQPASAPAPAPVSPNNPPANYAPPLVSKADPQNPPPVAQTPAPPPVPAAPSTPQAPREQDSPSSSGSDDIDPRLKVGINHKGDLTWYEVGMGSCGFRDGSQGETGLIVAISHELMDLTKTANPNKNSNCGRKVLVTVDGREGIQAEIRDRCGACKEGDLDVNPGLFKKLVGEAGLGVGRAKNMQWKFITN